MLLPWLFIVVFNVLDLWTTEALIRLYGSEVEANPITGWFIGHGWLLELKMSVIAALTLFCLWVKVSHRISVFKRNLWVVAVFYLCVVVSNVRYLTLAAGSE